MDIETLVDKKFTKVWVDRYKEGEAHRVMFEGVEGNYELTHRQDCCEHVYIEDIVVTSVHDGLECLENTPILKAERVTSNNVMPAGLKNPEDADDSYTWTFFKLTTLKGYVDIRFFGSSNGYYSEDAELCERN